MSDRKRLAEINTGSNAPQGRPETPLSAFTGLGEGSNVNLVEPAPAFTTIEQPISYSGEFSTPYEMFHGAPMFIPNTPTTPGPYNINQAGFITPGPGVAPQSEAAASLAMVEAAWNALIETSFAVPASELDFPGNWWPGLEVQNPIIKAQWGTAGLYRPEAAELFPENWAAPATDVAFTDPETGMEDSVWVRYDPARAAQQFFGMDAATREEYNSMMANAGIISEGWEGMGDYSLEGANAFAQVLQMANYYGISAKQVLTRQIRLADRERALRGGGGGGGGRGPQVKLEVPNYETLLVDAENLLESRVGRRLDEWEYSIIADHMQDKYGQWADAKKRAILGGNGTYEVPDPVKLTEGFVEDRYASEISRLEDTADTRETNSLLIDAATKGLQMMGGFGG